MTVKRIIVLTLVLLFAFSGCTLMPDKENAAGGEETTAAPISDGNDSDTFFQGAWISYIELKKLGRIHDYSDFLETYSLCRECGISNINVLDTWKSKMTSLKNSWVGKTATFALNQTGTAIQALLDKIKTLRDSWKDKVATFSLKFSAAASDLKAWVNNNVLSKVRSVFSKVPVLRNYTNKLYLAQGGVLDGATQFVGGEAGAEAVIPLERNLNGIRKIADVMLNGIEDASRFRYSANPMAFSGGISSSVNGISGSSDSQLIAEQNRLLQEQNRLLQQKCNNQ